jgi:DNA-binding MarR family transcriptional regulator
MMQLSIFEANSMVRRSDPDTSAKAAVKALEFKAGHEAQVYAALANGDMTAKEIAQVTGLTDVQVSRRLGAMSERKLIERTGVVRNNCCVWRKK